MIILLTVGLAKKIMLYKNKCFPPYSHSKNKIKVQLGLPNYPAKLKNATGVDTLQFANKEHLANLKSEVDKLNIDKISQLDTNKLKPVPTDLSKLNDVVKNDLVKNKDYNVKIKII